MDVFQLRNQLIDDYRAYTASFVAIRDRRIQQYVEEELESGALWPNPLIQLNPSFKPGATVGDLVQAGVLDPACAEIFRFGKGPDNPLGSPATLHRHQSDAVSAAQSGDHYVLITGTGSGKSLAYIIPIVNYALRNRHTPGIKAVIVYPMNALANSQLGELEKFLGVEDPPVTFARYTGQESDEQRNKLKASPPDILLTNYVMLEYIMTRPEDLPLILQMRNTLQFLVLDELHTYRGRQGADVALLVRRVREMAENPGLQVVGTSATLAGGATFAEQQKQVSELATRIFGSPVKPERVIGETLQRTTPDLDIQSADFTARLTERLRSGAPPPAERAVFLADPLSIWIETTFGLVSEPDGRLRRATPLSIESAAARMADQVRLSADACADAIRAALLAGYRFDKPVFVFRLHQFISRGDTVYASLEQPAERHISLSGQKVVPGDRNRIQLPLAFCRECGQEYYVVTRQHTEQGWRYIERDLGDQAQDTAHEQRGFLYHNPERPWWDGDAAYVLENVPESWVEDGAGGELRLTKTGRERAPQPCNIDPAGNESPEGMRYHFIPTPFDFCLCCGVSYHYTMHSDFGKLASLSAGGRSTATTVLALSALRTLRQAADLEAEARKLLSFTDNRQDASLQAGHTNDFVEVGLLRAALYQAVAAAGATGLAHDELAQRLFHALNLPFASYSADPTVKYGRDDIDKALRDVLAYRVYHDLRRGWRITAPNLEQCGLLHIGYKYLADLCADADEWRDCHPALATATPATRTQIAATLMDYLRRELAIQVDYLERDTQERIQQRSNQHLIAPWAIDDQEQMVAATVAFPCTQSAVTGKRREDNVYVSEYGGFGYFLRRNSTFPAYTGRITLQETNRLIRELLERLRRAQLVVVVREANLGRGVTVPGYRAKASGFIWRVGDGAQPAHDPIRVPRAAVGGGVTNRFFVHFYREAARQLIDVQAREHTAQVPMSERMEREERFRSARLPILYCSPTMELGVDIAQLNVVNMRNVPPTPANYAQRSGRAGRSGQPALVFTYCTTGSPHDQYHFKRPQRMVGGAVSTPRLDLANEDLLRAHMHAIWLAETGAKLGKSLKDVLDLDQPDELPLRTALRQQLQNPAALQRAARRARRVLESIKADLAAVSWYREDWLDRVLALPALLAAFEEACRRWRGLFWSAREQQRVQNLIARDPSRSESDRKLAAALRQEAERQLSLLIDETNVFQGDFYSYRYFAGEGFLPGYNFPRLPLSAYIPARRGRAGQEEFLNRPRFLAISEFGPRSIIYHEGSRYIINKVILPARQSDGAEQLMTRTAKLCPACGYLHPIDGLHDADVCERCAAPLGAGFLPDLFRMQNVAAIRRDRISSDEEERLRQGYDIVTGVRFADSAVVRSAEVRAADGALLWRIAYGDTATLWRINRGWSRRANPNELGFMLDVERGSWTRSSADPHEQDAEDPTGPAARRVIPYVEDYKNALLLEPAEKQDPAVIAALQSALQKAIQAVFQLEDGELACESLPDRKNRRQLLFYEATEGGAGVLRQILDDPHALGEVAREALRICHFDPTTGADLGRAEGAREPCELACYDCLLSYYNQPDHRLLDRQPIRSVLLDLTTARVLLSPGAAPRADQFEQLRALTGSDLEREWLDMVNSRNLRLPDAAQKLIEACAVRPDFFYESGSARVAVFIDGPSHDDPAQQEKDTAADDCLFFNAGIEVLRFNYKQRADWPTILSQRGDVFGR